MRGVSKTLGKDDPEFVKRIREQAAASYVDASLPKLVYGLGVKMDATKFKLDEQAIAEAPMQVSVSNPQVNILRIKEAFTQFADVLEKYYMNIIQFPDDKFSLFHKALHRDTIIVHIPKGTEITEPVIITLPQKGSLCQNIFIYVEENAQAELILVPRITEASFRSEFVEVYAKTGAKIKVSSLQTANLQTTNLSYRAAVLEKNAHIDWWGVELGSNASRLRVDSYLKGQGSSANNLGAFFGTEEQHYDIHMRSVHQGADTNSNIATRGILDKKAKSILRGLIDIQHSAPRSNGYEKLDVLLLSEGVQCDAVPDLLINNDEVKCSHGATIGQIDADKIFYLKSRGIPEQDATRLIVQGFLQPILQKINDPELEKEIAALLKERMIQ